MVSRLWSDFSRNRVVSIKFGPSLDLNRNRKSFGLKLLGWFFVIFASFWTLAAFSSTYFSHGELVQAYRTGKYSVVEGIVEDFHPMPYKGHQSECFRRYVWPPWQLRERIKDQDLVMRLLKSARKVGAERYFRDL